MNTIESIMNLMKHDLSAGQLMKLQSVLEAVLSVQKDLPELSDFGINLDAHAYFSDM